MTMLTVLLYGFYLLLFSIFVGLSIIIVGSCINEVKKRKPLKDESLVALHTDKTLGKELRKNLPTNN